MDYLLHLATLITIYSLLVLTLNMILGYLGILHLGHPGLYGIGAYTYAILSVQGWPFFGAVLAAGGLTALAGLLLSLPTLRLRSHFIGITTLGFLIIVNNIFINWTDLTRGPLGIAGVAKPEIFGFKFSGGLEFFLLTFVVVSICALVLYRLLHSPFAKVVESIREDETAAKVIGKDTLKYKIQVFVVSSFFAGIGGAFLASYLAFINPWNFAIDELILVLAMVIIGGMGSFWGSILGAALIVLLPEPLRFLELSDAIIGPLRFALFGLVIILFMIFRPNGFLGKRTNVFNK